MNPDPPERGEWGGRTPPLGIPEAALTDERDLRREGRVRRRSTLGGGRARLSAAAGDLRGGRESSRLALSGRSGFGAGRRPRHACGVSARAALAPLAVASGSKRRRCVERDGVGRAWEGCPGGGRGRRPPLGESGPRGSEGGGAAAAHWLPTRPPSSSTGAAAEMIVLSGCTGGGLPAGMPCDDCTEWMYW